MVTKTQVCFYTNLNFLLLKKFNTELRLTIVYPFPLRGRDKPLKPSYTGS